MRLGCGASSSPLVGETEMAVIDPGTDIFCLLQLIALEADRGCTAP